MNALHLTLFGGFSAQINEQSIGGRATFNSDKIRALLTYLAVEQDRPHRRETLATLLWSEMSDSIAKRNLRQSLYRLKQTVAKYDLTDEWLEMTRQTVLVRTGVIETDIGRFQQHLKSCHSLSPQQLANDETALTQLQTAVDLYRGEFLAGLHVDDALLFSEWQTVQRELLHQQALGALYLLTAARLQRGEYELAHRSAMRQLTLEPWREVAHRQAIQALAMQGERTAALAQFERCQTLLWEELGVDVSAETQQLYDDILANQFEAFAETELTRMYNFPVQLTPFIGRKNDITTLTEQLADPDTRLLTIVGVGGMGKTRLSVKTAETLAEQSGLFKDGLYFVPLAPLTNPDLLPTTIATALGLKFSATAAPETQLLAHLKDRACLLVLDNFEHLTAATDLVSAILDASLALKVLVTSRQTLNLPSERRLPLLGLQEAEGMALFAQTARRIQPRFAISAENIAAVQAIHTLTDGLPLALEMAASWTRMLSCQQIADQIAVNSATFLEQRVDLPDRHRSMRAVFEHSWALLNSAERNTLAQIAVFHGNASLDAILTITDANKAAIATLLDKSLLQRAANRRFALHELLRQYAVEKLAMQPTAAATIYTRHSRYYLEAIRAFQNGRTELLPALQANLDNIRAAWRYACANGDNALLKLGLDGLVAFYDHCDLLHEALEMLQLVTSQDDWLSSIVKTHSADFHVKLSQYDQAQRLTEQVIATSQSADCVNAARLVLCRTFELTSQHAAAMTQQELVLAHYQAQGDVANIGRATAARANIHWRTGNYDDAIHGFETALAIARRLDDQGAIETNLGNLSIVYREVSRYDEAIACIKQALAIVEALGLQEGIARHNNNLGLVYWQLERREEALACYQKAAQIAESLDIQRGVAICVSNMGVIYHELGRWQESAECYQRAIKISRRLGVQQVVVNGLGNLGNVYIDSGQFAEAHRYIKEALHIADEHGMREAQARLTSALGQLLVAEEDYHAAGAVLPSAIAKMRELKTRYLLSQTLAHWGRCLIAFGRINEAVRANDEAAELAQTIGRSNIIHLTNCYKIRLLHLQGQTDDALELAALCLQETPDAVEQADYYYERWLIGGKSADKNAAHTRYASAYERQPYFTYKHRLRMLGVVDVSKQT